MQDWYAAQDPEVQVQFEATLLILAGIADWEDEDVEEFKPLTEQHIRLDEVVVWRRHVLDRHSRWKPGYRLN